jgi:hypothetical protein
MGDAVLADVEALAGQAVAELVPIDRGHIANRRYRAVLRDGTSVFVKSPSNAYAAAAFADERLAYESIGEAPFLPKYLGSTDRALVVHFVDDARWPPPWRDGELALALDLVTEIGAAAGPAALRDLDDDDRHHVWSQVAAEPGPFLSLSACDGAWFDAHVDVLTATDRCRLSGSALVHGDFRSDNLCIVDGRGLAVDWGAAARGRPDYDLVGFAITAADETGCTPDELAPHADPALVGVYAGVFAHAAGNPLVPAPIRAQLERFLRVALPWSARLLDLPPPPAG